MPQSLRLDRLSQTRRRSARRFESLEARQMLASDLVITEMVASNRQGLRDEDGDRSDWLEIYNSGSELIDLGGYYLTDDANDLTKWKLPTRSIDPKAYEVIFASGKDRTNQNQPLHTSFRLSAAGGSLTLVEPDGTTVAYSYDDYPQQYEDVSYGTPQPIASTMLLGRASLAKFIIPTFDSPGDAANWTALEFDDTAWSDGVGSIGFDHTGRLTDLIDTDVQAEMQNINTTAYARYTFELDELSTIQALQLRMRSDDGYVAYLNGIQVATSLAPEDLTYDAKAVASRPTDEKSVYESIDVSSFLEHLAVGTNVLAVHGLNRSIRSSYFVSPELVVQRPGEVQSTVARYFQDHSPGMPNGDVSYAGVLSPVELDAERGFYDTAQDITITGTDAGAAIVYTMDGSTPSSTNGTVVPSVDSESVAVARIPISKTTTLRTTSVMQDQLSAPATTNTYVFVDDVIKQSPEGDAPEGWPARSINGQQFNYGMDPDVVEDPEYAPLIRDALLDISSISIVTDQEHLFDPNTGIFVNAERARENNAAWERPTSVELIHPDGTQGFQIDAGFRIRGGASRTGRNAKHAFRLFFRTEYGESKLRYPLFGDEGVDEFDNIDLRSPSLPSWHSCNLGHPRWGCKRSTFLRDVFGRDSQGDMGLPYTRSRYYHLYLNGQYWGLFQSQERSEASYAESYFGGDKSDYDVVKVEGPPRRTVATDGTIEAWRALWEMGIAGFETDEAYFRAQGLNPDGTRNPEYPVLLNVQNLADYMVLQFYSGNWDGPISDNIGNQETNNWFGILDREGDTGFQFFVHDGEYMMFDVETNRLGPWPAGNTFQHSNPQWLHQQLVKNENYRAAFGDRAYKHLFNDGALTPENARARFLERLAEVDLAIIAESARWGDSFRREPFTKKDWQVEVDWILEEFFPRRTDIVIEQFKNSPVGEASDLIAPIFPTVDAPTFSQHGGQITPDFSLFMTAPDAIYFTLDGTDPMQGVPEFEYELLVQRGDTVRFHVPADDSLADRWQQPEFNSLAWTAGESPIGYHQEGDQLEGAIATDVTDAMAGTNSSVYARIPFSVDDPLAFDVFELGIQYDDAFVAYLNGTEIARSNLSGDAPEWDSRSAATRGSRVNLQFFETVNLDDHLDLLRPGDNVLAIHGINRRATDGDFFVLPELRAGVIRSVGLAPNAKNYATPITLDTNTVVTARALRGNQWSALNQAVFTTDQLPLQISEIMYHPADPTTTEEEAGFTNDDDFEFIELENHSSDETIDLAGVTLSEAINFTFPNVELGPGERIILARNTKAFELRHGTDSTVAGQYGDQDNGGKLNNGGETIRLSDRLGILIQEFTYDDWYPESDGDGKSLELSANASPDNLSTAAAWHPSEPQGGTPGRPRAIAGDVNQDGVFDSADLTELFGSGEYEDGINGNSTWYEGDFDGDGDFTTRDLVHVFMRGTYTQGLGRNAAAAIDAILEFENNK